MKTEFARAMLTLTLSLLLISCGGGTTDLSGVGTGGTGITSGTVTGFGSILIDGDLYGSATGDYLEGDDDDEASLVSALSVDLGEQLQIQLDDQGNPTSVLIEPALIGTVSTVDVVELERAIRQAVVRFEPRLLPHTVRVRVVASDEHMSHNALTFFIEAQLWAQPLPLQMFLKTEIDLELGNVTVVEQAGQETR